MVARSVDQINITNWQVTGLNVSIPQYSFVIEIKWTDNSGVKHTYGPITKKYPNDIADMPLAVRRQFAEQMIIMTARVALGIDEWSV
jgi:hypothetical protein